MGGPSQQEQGQQSSAWSNLNSLFGTSSNASQGLGASGTQATGAAQNFFNSVLGNRTAQAQAVAPAASAATAGAQAQKNQLASEGTGRTGGAVATSQQIDDATRAQIDSLIGAAAPAAANSLEGIGSTQVADMLNALGIGNSAAGTLGGQTTQDIQSQRQATAQMWASIIGGAGKLGAIAATGGAAAPLVALSN